MVLSYLYVNYFQNVGKGKVSWLNFLNVNTLKQQNLNILLLVTKKLQQIFYYQFFITNTLFLSDFLQIQAKALLNLQLDVNYANIYDAVWIFGWALFGVLCLFNNN
eukprot:TRINITY_DN7453_c0_g1_i1.p3 TRINITY_DN7453_c0_g1~~TRINITY_DN7453_c0_g1_i1.p3  ORF type:complete len:106 (-),score=5.04 TRINITY_DN7453_c0_g1_i1:355-672(-)